MWQPTKKAPRHGEQSKGLPRAFNRSTHARGLVFATELDPRSWVLMVAGRLWQPPAEAGFPAPQNMSSESNDPTGLFSGLFGVEAISVT